MRFKKTSVLSLLLTLVCIFSSNILFAQQNKSDDGGYVMFGTQTITGKACYRFSDQESIQTARDIALSMAKRDALEGTEVYVNATSTVENNTVRNQIIQSVSGALLKNYGDSRPK